MDSVCVYCGSGSGNDPAFVDAARLFGRALAEADVALIYGGGSIGLMGEVAAATLGAGGTVVGVIPTFLRRREVALDHVSELIETEDMHARKRIMFDRSDAFVALPGGIGTLEELVEMMTWSQLGQHDKPIVLANVHGFWDKLKALIDHMDASGFIRPGWDVVYDVVDDVDAILPLLQRRHTELSAAREPKQETLSRL